MQSGLAQRIKQTREFESSAQEAMLNLFVAAAHVRRKVERLCQDFDIQFSHYNVLRILRGVHPDGHARCDIIERMIDPSPDVTRLTDKLVDRGLVQRTRSEEDRRVTLHTITEEGLALLDEMQPAITAIQEEFDECVAPRDLEHLSRICEGIYRNYDDTA
jgi:DNA-binding MarR family transcriptional regulator